MNKHILTNCAAVMRCSYPANGALSTSSQEREMADSTRSKHDIDFPAELPIQPTGNGVTDMEIVKLKTAIEDGAEDTTIETPIPDDEPTKTQA